QELFIIITLVLGIIWSGILAYFAARFITKPLERLEVATSLASKGDLNQEVKIHSSDDEIRALSMAFDTMLKNLANMVRNIEEHFDDTNASIAEIQSASNEAAKHATLISSSSDDISTGAESSAEAIQQTAEAVEDATGLAKDVQVTADRSKEKASEMLEII